MRRILQIILLLLFAFNSYCQKNPAFSNESGNKTFSYGANAGVGWAYEDKAHLFNSSVGFSIDYNLNNKYSLQFAPKYSWLRKWNEHYLTLPFHIRKRFGEKYSLFTGTALTFDWGYFKDLGISAGFSYDFGKSSTILISAFTFSLYDYHIDYLYVPVSVCYGLRF